MAKCWEQRGCDDEMQAACPHAVELHDNCPTKCAFAACQRPNHDPTSDAELIFDPSVDRTANIRDECLFCAFFIKHGPRVSQD